MAFDVVVLSTNDSPLYYQCAPLVVAAWRKFFPRVEVMIAYTGRLDLVPRLQQIAPVAVFENKPGYPSGNWAKMIRYFLAAKQGNRVCMIHDMDSLPLQRQYYIDLTKDRAAGFLLCVGWEVYAQTEHSGKFPAGCMCAEGWVFDQILRQDDVRVGLFDHKEDLNAHPDVFSDESLMRALIAQWPSPRLQFVPREVNIHRDWVDRSWWAVDVDRLNRGPTATDCGYAECNLLRPPSAHWPQIKPIADYILGKDATMNEALLA